MKKIDDPPDVLDAVDTQCVHHQFSTANQTMCRCVTGHEMHHKSPRSLGAPASVHSAPTSTDWTDGIHRHPLGQSHPWWITTPPPKKITYTYGTCNAWRKMPHLTTKKCNLMINIDKLCQVKMTRSTCITHDKGANRSYPILSGSSPSDDQ